MTPKEINEKLAMSEPGCSAWFYCESASLNYLKERMESDKSLPTNRIEEQVEVTPKKVIPGYSTMPFMHVGKALIPMSRYTPSRTIPATFRTDVHNQPYITKPIMEQWIKR